MSDGISIDFIDFAAVSVAFDGVRRVPIKFVSGAKLMR
jgi:hypothetical protein